MPNSKALAGNCSAALCFPASERLAAAQLLVGDCCLDWSVMTAAQNKSKKPQGAPYLKPHSVWPVRVGPGRPWPSQPAPKPSHTVAQ